MNAQPQRHEPGEASLRGGRGRRRRSRAYEAALLAVVVAPSLWLTRSWFWSTPLSHDHPTHIYHAWYFWTHLLGEGRLRGFSHFWGFGYPAGELTPFGANLWVAAFRVATFGTLSWLRTYSIALIGVQVLFAIATYVFARRHFGTATGVVASVLASIDPGAWAQGGWNWHTEYGVWPITLGTAFALLCLERVDRIMDCPRRRDLLLAAAWMGISFVTHQVTILLYGAALPLLFLARWLSGRLQAWSVGRVAAVSALGFGLAAVYLIPVFARSGMTLDLGVLGNAPEDIVKRFTDGRHLEGLWPLFTVLGVAGSLLALGSRSASGIYFVFCAWLFLVLTTDLLTDVLHLERLSRAVLKIEAARMALVAKLFWLPLVGYALTEPLRGVRTWFGAGVPRKIVGWACMVALAAPVAKTFLSHFYDEQVEKVTQTEKTTPNLRALTDFGTWSAKIRRNTSDFYRIAYELPAHDHLPTLAPVFNDTPAYKVGYTPAQQFRSFPMSDEPWLFEALSVRYVVADHVIDREDLEYERSFGALRVYKVRSYTPRIYRVVGDADVEQVRVGAEELRFRVRRAAPGTRLLINVAYHPRWEATLGGARVPISISPVHGAEYPLAMEVPVREGELVFRYVRRGADWIGLGLSIGSLVVFMAWAFGVPARPLARFRDGTARFFRGRARRIRQTTAVLAAAVAGLVVWKIASSPAPIDPRSIFRERDLTMRFDRYPCHSIGPLVWACGEARIRAAVVGGTYGSHACMKAGPDGKLEISFPRGPETAVFGQYESFHGGGRITVGVDDESPETAVVRGPWDGLVFLQFALPPRRAKASRVRIKMDGSAFRCFDFRRDDRASN